MSFIINPYIFGANGYVIENALRFNSADSAYLSRTFGTGDSTLSWTISTWVKRCEFTTAGDLVFGLAASPYDWVGFGDPDSITTQPGIVGFSTAGGVDKLESTAQFRDPTAWSNFVWVYDSANGTAGDRHRIYKDGVRITDFSLEADLTLNQNSTVNTAVTHYIGRQLTNYANFYLAETVFLDGTSSTDATEFGEFDTNGNWVPKEITIATDTGDVLIGGGEGTIIDNPNTSWNSGPATRPAGAFDGTYTGGYAGGGVNGAAPCSGSFVGKDWGVGVSRTLTNCKVYPTTGGHFSNTGTGTFKLYGSDSDPGTDGTDGTELATWSTSTYPDTTTAELTPVSTTAYRYHWVTATHTASVDWALMEIEFIEDGIPGFGTNGFWLDFADSADLGKDVSGSFSLNLIDDTQTYTTDDGTGQGPASNAADGNSATRWGTANNTSDNWWSVDFGSGQEKTVIRCDFDFVSDFASVADVLVYGGNSDVGGGPVANGATLLHTEVDPVTANNTTTAMEFSNSTAYRYYWLLFEGNAFGTTVCEEIRMYSTGDYGLNHFTPSGFAANDSVTDTPTDSADDGIGNYCTMSPIFGLASAVYSNGNLTVDADDDSAWGTTFASSGKYYFEIKQTATHNANLIGVAQDTGFKHAKGGSYAGSGGHADNANAYGFYSTTGTSKKVDQAGTTTTYGGNATASGTVLQCALDLDNGLIWFGWNDANWIDPAGAASSATVKASMEAGESTYAAFTGITGSFAPWHFNANGVSCDFNFGSQGFNHTPPAGFKAWHTANLPAPAIKDPSEGFVIVEDTEANIAATLATARSGWTDYIDFIKDKSSTDSWIVRFSDDSTNHMKFDTNAATATFPTLSGSNVHVGYSLRVGAAYGVFTDSVSHTNGADTNTAHGLGSNNKWCLAKLESTTGSWYHKHPANSASKNSTIDVSAAEGATFYVDVDSTNVTIQSAAPTGTYRVWVLEETSGLISLPSYTGNGSADGPFVHCGLTPHWLWRWGISVGDNYYTNNALTSSYNPTNHRFILDVAQAASTNADIDITASGYKIRETTPNSSGTTYGSIVFGSRPFGGSGVSQARAR